LEVQVEPVLLEAALQLPLAGLLIIGLQFSRVLRFHPVEPMVVMEMMVFHLLMVILP
jgi:hypothetical protein